MRTTLPTFLAFGVSLKWRAADAAGSGPDCPGQGLTIPEIQDLNVIRSRRREGIASWLLDEAEARIVKQARYAGIGFGLYADYGAAQRLYIQRGYVPEGRGIHYRNESLPPGACCTVDDDLVLYLVKPLR